MKIKVEKDFLPQDDFNKLKNKVLRSNFFYNGSVAGVGAHDDGYYFTHTLFENFKIRSDLFDLMIPVLNKIKAKALFRAKINLYPKTSKIIEHDQHIDTNFKCKAFILSLNTCNGYTKIGKDTKIPSIENQGIFFEGNKLHNSTTCTDENIRLNINFNYF